MFISHKQYVVGSNSFYFNPDCNNFLLIRVSHPFTFNVTPNILKFMGMRLFVSYLSTVYLIIFPALFPPFISIQLFLFCCSLFPL